MPRILSLKISNQGMRFTLLNTRPAKQATSLNDLVSSAGGEFLNCPTLKIVPTENPFSHSNAGLANLKADKVIFISANAVEQFVKQNLLETLKHNIKHADFYAIGRATALMGSKYKLPIKTLSDTQFDSESLLAHSAMQTVVGQTIFLVKGQGGRELLQNTLIERGANVKPIELYERRAAPFCKEAWMDFTQRSNAVLLITSIASWDAFYNGYSQLEVEPTEISKDLLIVVMSQRIADHIATFAWPCQIIVVSTQSNAGIIKAIEEGLS